MITSKVKTRVVENVSNTEDSIAADEDESDEPAEDRVFMVCGNHFNGCIVVSFFLA